MGSAAHQLAVLEGARLALVGVADNILLGVLSAADGGPLAMRGKPGAAHAPELGDLQVLEDAVGVAASRETADGFVFRFAVVRIDLPAERLPTGLLVRQGLAGHGEPHIVL